MSHILEIIYQQEKTLLKREVEEWYQGFLGDKTKLSYLEDMDIYADCREHYREQIYNRIPRNGADADIIRDLDLEIVFCRDDYELTKQWNYYRMASGSTTSSEKVYRSFKYMIKDRYTNTYLGIVELSHTAQAMEARDIKLGWTRANRQTRILNFKIEGYNTEDECNIELTTPPKGVAASLRSPNGDKDPFGVWAPIDLRSIWPGEMTQPLSNYVTHVTTCMGLQPIAYNLNVGKLLVASIFSTEVLEEYYRKFQHYYGCIVATSMYGKSVQYDRMKELQYVGETSGYDMMTVVPRELFSKIESFMEQYHRDDYVKYAKMSTYNTRIMMAFGTQMEIDFSGLFNGMKKGIYMGFTANDPVPFYTNRTRCFSFTKMVRPMITIVDWWKGRWAYPRFLHLCETNQVRVCVDLRDSSEREKDLERTKQKQYETLFDVDWVSMKREKNRMYYYQNKEDILNEVKVIIDQQFDRDFYMDHSYLSGFFDGDGSIYLNKCGFLIVTFSQCVLNILLKIQMKYGGMITVRDTQKANQRTQYNLTLIGPDCEKILTDMLPCSILKLRRIEAGLEYLRYRNQRPSPEKTAIIRRIYDLQNIKNEDDADLERINWGYVAGIFDAEGCVCVKEGTANFCVSIAQAYVPNFLSRLKTFIMTELDTDRVGISDTIVYFANKKTVVDFYHKVKNYLIVKGYQYHLSMELIKEYYGEKNMDKILEYGSLIKANKHQDVDYDIDINKTNIVVYVKNKVAQEIEKKLQSDIHKQTFTKITQAMKKEGVLNPNYGHEMLMETKVKSSISNMKSKRGAHLSDERIHAILEYRDKKKDNGKKYLQQEVADMFHMDRRYISMIWLGKILPLDTPNLAEKIAEMKTQKAKNRHIPASEKISESKRRISMEDIYEIFEWRIKQKNGERFLDNKAILSTKVAKYMSEKNGRHIDDWIVKNYWFGRTKLREEHFVGSNITYEQYLELLK